MAEWERADLLEHVPNVLGGILTAALGSLLGRTHPLLAAAAERPFTRLPALANCSVSMLRWPGPDLLGFNATDHLAGLDDEVGTAPALESGQNGPGHSGGERISDL